MRVKLVVGQVRVAVRASGVNFADVMAIRGQHQNTPPVPFTPGFEFAGEVIEVASDVKKFQVGDKVVVAFGHGSHQAEAIAPVTQVFPIPANMDFSTAAAFPVAFGTAYTASKLRAALRPAATSSSQEAGRSRCGADCCSARNGAWQTNFASIILLHNEGDPECNF